MTLIEALKSGKRFRIWGRKWHGPYEGCNSGKLFDFTGAEVLATDWEIEPEPSTYRSN